MLDEMHCKNKKKEGVGGNKLCMIIGKSKMYRNHSVRAGDIYVAFLCSGQHLNIFLHDILNWGEFQRFPEVGLIQQS